MQTDISFDTFLFRNILIFPYQKVTQCENLVGRECYTTDAIITIIDDAKFLQN